MGDVADERGDLLHAPIETRVAHAVGDRGRVIGMSLRVQVKNVQKEARGQGVSRDPGGPMVQNPRGRCEFSSEQSDPAGAGTPTPLDARGWATQQRGRFRLPPSLI